MTAIQLGWSRRGLVLMIGVLLAAVSACGSSGPTLTSGSGKVLRVPSAYATIQKAVTASKPGDLVLISPGVYKEQVNVDQHDITIRGTDRNKVIVDGEFKRENGIRVSSNNVAVENLTSRDNTSNGIFISGDGKGGPVTGYRVSYVTAYDNGADGISASNAQRGQFDHDDASGQPGSGYHIDSCAKCSALLTDDTAETNFLGYSGTNSTGVTIVNSLFDNNRAGIVPRSESTGQHGAGDGTVIVGNQVRDNHNAKAPLSTAGPAIAYGNGIELGGISHSIVERNLITGNITSGVMITDDVATSDPAAKNDQTYKPASNQVKGNVLKGNGYDLVYLVINEASQPFDNCYADNTFQTSFPDGIEQKMPCTSGLTTDLGNLGGIISRLPAAPPDVNYKTIAAPADQPEMPRASTTVAVGAKGVTGKVDLAPIKVPTV
jgi:hypothetical protein